MTQQQNADLTRDLDTLVDAIRRIEGYPDDRVANLREVFFLDVLRADALRLSNDLALGEVPTPATETA